MLAETVSVDYKSPWVPMLPHERICNDAFNSGAHQQRHSVGGYLPVKVTTNNLRLAGKLLNVETLPSNISATGEYSGGQTPRGNNND